MKTETGITHKIICWKMWNFECYYDDSQVDEKVLIIIIIIILALAMEYSLHYISSLIFGGGQAVH